MRLYKTSDHFSLQPVPNVTFPQEVVGKELPANFVANIAYMRPGKQNPMPAHRWMTGWGIRYVGWNMAQENPDHSRERLACLDAPSGAAVHMSLVVEDEGSVELLLSQALHSLPADVKKRMKGKLKVEFGALQPGNVIGFL